MVARRRGKLRLGSSLEVTNDVLRQSEQPERAQIANWRPVLIQSRCERNLPIGSAAVADSFLRNSVRPFNSAYSNNHFRMMILSRPDNFL